jgi:hypothetical protein
MPSTTANTANPGTFASLLSGVGNTSANPQNNLIGQGGTGGFLGSVYGQIPGVANPLSSAAQATKGDVGDLTNVANLAQGADTISAAGAALPFNLNLPGYGSNLEQNATNVGQELQGDIPQDVQNQIEQSAAERGIATGQGAGSPNEGAALERALGLTSLGEMQAGQTGLSTLIGETPTGTPFNPASQFVTPQDEQAANQAANNAAAAPDPGTSGLLSTIFSFL